MHDKCNLFERHCVPCKGGVPPMPHDEITAYLHHLSPDWTLADGKRAQHIERKFRFPNFKAALHFVNRVGAIAEHENHHPDITFGWGYVTVRMYTHKINGLTENDFILAAKCDALK